MVKKVKSIKKIITKKPHLVDNSKYFVFNKINHGVRNYYVHQNLSVIDSKGKLVGAFDRLTNKIIFFDNKK